MWKRTARAGIRRFIQDDSGTSAIEFGLIAAGIAVAAAIALDGVGAGLQAVFGQATSKLATP